MVKKSEANSTHKLLPDDKEDLAKVNWYATSLLPCFIGMVTH